MVNEDSLNRWRGMAATDVLQAVADHAKRDVSYVPVKTDRSSRWHASASGRDFELLCTGPKFWDTRANKGGGGALDLVMHLYQIPFLRAARLLEERGL